MINSAAENSSKIKVFVTVKTCSSFLNYIRQYNETRYCFDNIF